MTKVPKVKKKGVSVHSRAARRGAEPARKDLESIKPPKEETDYKPWLHNAQNAGIQKKQKKKQLTTAQKRRQEKALEKADAITGKHEKKVADSKKRSARTQARAKEWEDLNSQLEAAEEAKEEAKKAAKTSRTTAATGEGEQIGDEVMPDLAGSGATAEAVVPTVPEGAPQWASMHAQTGDFVDEIT
ncbi:Putative ribosome biogenesis protein Alb1 [Septoria linicola]|uniref:Ribosome biogenesis protein Alb1 n=1 Tax=Septoria linicola TaxID=215465 RepID=A0A9Q9EGZ2_9PEZI|nr:Putative ribosome biogenesis protein Alb1 [Septoria linicola]